MPEFIVAIVTYFTAIASTNFLASTIRQYKITSQTRSRLFELGTKRRKSEETNEKQSLIICDQSERESRGCVPPEFDGELINPAV